MPWTQQLQTPSLNWETTTWQLFHWYWYYHKQSWTGLRPLISKCDPCYQISGPSFEVVTFTLTWRRALHLIVIQLWPLSQALSIVIQFVAELINCKLKPLQALLFSIFLRHISRLGIIRSFGLRFAGSRFLLIWLLSPLTVSFTMYITLCQCWEIAVTPLIVTLSTTFALLSTFYIQICFRCCACQWNDYPSFRLCIFQRRVICGF